MVSRHHDDLETVSEFDPAPCRNHRPVISSGNVTDGDLRLKTDNAPCSIASRGNHTLLAETLLGSIERRVRNAFIFLQFCCEIIDDLFIGAHASGPATVGDCVGNVFGNSRFERNLPPLWKATRTCRLWKTLLHLFPQRRGKASE